MTERESIRQLKALVADEAFKLNHVFDGHEKYTQGLATGIYTQIKQDSVFFTDRKNLEAHVEEIRNIVISSSVALGPEAKSVYVKFNPAVSYPEAGTFIVRGSEPNAPFVQHELTDIEKYSPNDIEHVGWYYKPIQTGKPMWLPPYYNKNIDVYMISYVIPFFVGNQELGVTGVDIDFDRMSKSLANVQFLKTGYAYIEDSDGSIIYHPSLSKELMFKPGNDQMKISEKLLNGMSFVCIVPKAEVYERKNKLITQCYIFIAIVLFLTALIAVISTRKILSPLKKLTDEAKKMVTGDMKANFGIIQQNDEIGDLAKSFAAAKLHISQYMKQMQGLAFRDSLTGVRNKLAYDAYLNEMNERVDRGEIEKYGVVILDTNNLKEINDNYGHENGDVYLVNACKLVCQIFSHSPVFRIGGDEFLVVLIGADLDNHRELIKKLKEGQDLTKNAAFPWKQISIASGFAVNDNAKEIPFADTFRKADDNMYKNKRAIKAALGKNSDEN